MWHKVNDYSMFLLDEEKVAMLTILFEFVGGKSVNMIFEEKDG